MAYFNTQHSASPVITMTPQLPHQSPLGMASFTHHRASPRSFNPSVLQTTLNHPPRPAAAGRKRSRDEASANLEEEVTAAPPKEPEEEWVYGEGMVLIKPSSRYLSDATSQSGTWLEEKKAAEEAALDDQRSMLRAYKSQRTGGGSDTSVSVPRSTSASPSCILDNSPSSSDGKIAPVIDDFTMHLGIGWRKISEDEHIQAAARGWARYIENHYPVTSPRVLLESNGLQSYLVEAAEGFFLFAENLRQGQFVSPTPQGALHNLQCTPPVFDAASVLTAAGSPSSSANDMDMNMD